MDKENKKNDEKNFQLLFVLKWPLTEGEEPGRLPSQCHCCTSWSAVQQTDTFKCNRCSQPIK